MKCPLCDSNKHKPYGKSANGFRKYCCKVCNNIFLDGIEVDIFTPEINFLKFKEKRLIHKKITRLRYKILILKNFLNKKNKRINNNLNQLANKIIKNRIDWTLVFGIYLLLPINYLINKLKASIDDFRQKNKKDISLFLLYLIPNLFKKIFSIIQTYRWGLVGFFVALSIYSFMCIWLRINVNEPQPYDSYTLQALAWRSGHLELSQDYPWLEIAKYKGKYFLSFPPVPTIPMLLLTFLFGEKTPSTWLMITCFFSSYGIAYKLLRRFQNSDFQSAIWAVFLICGSSYLDISLFGWVWYMAQSLSFVLTITCLLCLTYSSHKMQGFGLFCFALTVGCRPLQAIYTPLVVGIVYQKNHRSTIVESVKVIIPILIPSTIVAIILGILNFLRFDSPLEFGHNYLPVLLAEPQFSFGYIERNFLRIFTVFPKISSLRQIDLPRFGGFAFYLANPIFIILAIRLIIVTFTRKIDWFLCFLLASMMLNFFVLMMHITFGAWQFGTRFLVDLLPAVLVLCTRIKQPLRMHEILIMIFGLAFNVCGGIYFRSS